MKCDYCHSNFIQDSRGCCSACGAPTTPYMNSIFPPRPVARITEDDPDVEYVLMDQQSGELVMSNNEFMAMYLSLADRYKKK